MAANIWNALLVVKYTCCWLILVETVKLMFNILYFIGYFLYDVYCACDYIDGYCLLQFCEPLGQLLIENETLFLINLPGEMKVSFID